MNRALVPRTATITESPPDDKGKLNFDALAIFEGGGAKGLAHIAALKATEELGIRFLGVAGTSAGAIIAALVAIGYSADELLNPRNRSHVLRRVCNLDPLALFGGRPRWRRFQGFSEVLNFLFSPAWPGPIPLPRRQRLGSRLRLIIDPLNFLRLAIVAILKVLVLAAACVIYTPVLYRAVKRRGWFNSEEARRCINQLLYAKLHGLDVAPQYCSPVVFRELPMPLKIVATNIDRREIMVFGTQETPDAEVAVAVAASIALPLVFSPQTIDAGRLLDGGLVSNLPTWLFDDERLDQPGIPTIAFTLPADGGIGATENFGKFVMRIARSAVFGHQSVGQRFIDNLVVIDLPAKIDVLDFHPEWDTAIEVHEKAREEARKQLMRQFRARSGMNNTCKIAHDLVRTKLSGVELGRLRVNIAVPVSPNYLRVKYSYNMDGDADDTLYIPKSRGISGSVLIKREIGHAEGEQIRFLSGHGSNDKYRQALVWPKLFSVISVPIFASDAEWRQPPARRRPPIAILNFDSDGPLIAVMKSKEILDFIERISMLVSRAMNELLRD